MDGREELGTFLSDNEIGPLTGLAKRFADLELYEEPHKLPERLRMKAFFGILACCYLREQMDRVDMLIEDPSNPLASEDIVSLEEEICDPHEQHRFDVLVSDFQELRNREKSLKRALRIMRRRRGPHELHNVSGKDKKQVERKRRETEYRTLRGLLGIEIAEGRIDSAMSYADQMRRFFDNGEEFENFGHSRAVVGYLDNGGYHTLRNRAAFGRGTNPYWWRTEFGRSPGVYHKYVVTIAQNIINDPIPAIVSAGAGALLYRLYESFFK
jgi:hypothetical protein